MERNDLLVKLQIYTDGACSGNPGPGGWACIINLDKKIKKISGGKKCTTNNQMELTAVLMSLSWLLKNHDKLESNGYDCYEIYSDSAYAINTFTNWMYSWERNNWTKSDGKVPENLDLVKAFFDLSKTMDINFIKVKGHKGNKYNELADKLATSA